MDTLELDGKWQVREAPLSWVGTSGYGKAMAEDSEWIPAQVPGEIHLDLMRAGRMDEPLVSLNAKKSRWPEQRSWWYTKTFTVSPTFLKHERQELVLDGLDYFAQVFLNGEFIGEVKNAFVPAKFDVRHRLKKGKNEVVVRLTAGGELVPPEFKPTKEEKYKRQSFRGIRFLRKPQFTFGWDWVDILPNIGIWRSVHLEGRSGVVLHDVSLTPILCESSVLLDAEVVVENLHPWGDREAEVAITIEPPSGKKIQIKAANFAQVGLSTLSQTIEIPNPRLWWPNGMGEHPLYQVSISVSWDGTECDRREMHIGLRTVEIDRTKLAEGSRFCIKVNGQDVFCKGGNWIPADAIVARVEPKKYEVLVSDAKNANLNMLRIWGGGVYEAPAFYNACDKAGILVWQDFMFSCSEYPDHDPAFRNAIRAEAESVVKSLRHHPCIALWSGNNENIWGFENWWNKDRSIGDKDLQVGGKLLYNQVLPEVCRTLDPSRPYWPSSPYGGERPNDETEGDCHWWLPFTMNPDMKRRISHEVFDECKGRFVSEYGVIGYCHMDSIKQFLKPEERVVGSPAWKEHTNTFENETIPAAIQHHYADFADIDLAQRILYGQMFQATMYGRTIEALRFRKCDPRDDCQGAVIWMYNDCWGETGWTPIDYYLRRKASYYWIRNACTPAKAIVRRRGNDLVTRVVNDTRQSFQAKVHRGWLRVDGTDSKMKSEAVTMPANGMLGIGKEKIPAASTMNPREWIYAAYLTGKGVESAPSTWLLAPYRELAVKRADICTELKGKVVTLTSDAYCHGVHCEDGGGRVFSDNFFDLLPGVPKRVVCEGGQVPKGVRFQALT
ncbi:MAG: sugar-binding domain-containing protein [Candidatus Hydrogenedentales bacterium]|jgi:beta-mannosidase